MWELEGAEEKREWRGLLKRTLVVITLNYLLFVPFELYLVTGSKYDDERASYTLEDLPTPWTLFWQNYFVNFLEDILFTLGHKLLHTPFLYKHVHKWHHKYTQPVGICAFYAHPIEIVIFNNLAFFIPMVLLGRSLH